MAAIEQTEQTHNSQEPFPKAQHTIDEKKMAEEVDQWSQTLTEDITGVALVGRDGYELKPSLKPREAKLAQQLLDYKKCPDQVDPRGGLMQKFNRELSAEDKDALKDMTEDAKGLFRRQWAEKQLVPLCETKNSKRTWKKVDTSKGTYMSASKIFTEEGGQTKADMEAAKNICQQCKLLGSPFIEYNKWSKRYDFLYFRKQNREEMERAWSLMQEYNGDGTPEISSGGASGKNNKTKGASKSAIASESRGAQVGKGAQNIKAENAAEATPPLKRQKKGSSSSITSPSETSPPNLAKSFKVACELRQKHSMVLSQVKIMMERISIDKEWAWANNKSTKQVITECEEDLTKQLDDFGKCFLSMQLEDVKKQYDKNDLKKKCDEYVMRCAEGVGNLVKAISKLSKMHAIHIEQI